jgi:3-isopropylmalate/(R)-2-methylmalate dehydratase small subunit
MYKQPVQRPGKREAAMIIRGAAHRFGDDINTDYIISAKHKAATLDVTEMAKYAMADIDPAFASRVRRGDIVVAGRNFGCGSSRETAVAVLVALGVSAVLASSFARIFFRNAINLGLPALECDTAGIGSGDEIEILLDRGTAVDRTRLLELPVTPLPPVMQAVLAAGGLAPYLREHGDLVLPGG